MKNPICECGHLDFEHEHRGQYYSSILQDICHQCLVSKYDTENKFIHEYHMFKPDNLKYLEQIYSNKVNDK